jgi:hypothetical protein
MVEPRSAARRSGWRRGKEFAAREVDGPAVIAPFEVASILVRNDSGREFITVDT